MKYFLFAALSVILVPSVVAQGYTIIDLGPMAPVAINSEGAVVGNLNGHAVIWTARDGVYDLGILPGGTFSVAAGINDLGAVTGTADGYATISGSAFGITDCEDLMQPFLWTPNGGFKTAPSIPVAFQYLVVPCAQADYATGVNLRNEVVGGNADIQTYKWGFIWDPSSDLNPTFGGYQTSANAINDFGVVVGQISQHAQLYYNSHSALWKNGVVADIGTLTGVDATWASCSGASSINDMGQIVGWSSVSAATQYSGCMDVVDSNLPVHAFLFQNASGMQDLGALPGDSSSVALKINLFGQVIGSSGNSVTINYDDSPYQYRIQVSGRPFSWNVRSGMRDLNDLVDHDSGWVLNSATDINNWGQIVGLGTHDGQAHGYLMTPNILFR